MFDMKYVALLRGINVGGKNLVTMESLRKKFESLGFMAVSTYINSGNVLFESKDPATKINLQVEKALDYCVVVRSQSQLKKVLEQAPKVWKEEDVRKYVAFIKEPLTADEVIPQIKINEAVDMIHAGLGVIYMTTKLEGLTKSGFSKMIGKKFFQSITIRNYNTTKKLLDLME